MDFSKRNWFVTSDLVKMSASWVEEDMYWSCMSFWTTFSRTKWWSTSIHLVLPWKNEFLASCLANWLLHHKDGGSLKNTHKSRRSSRIQYKSIVVVVNTLYVALVELRDTIFYFLAAHDIELLPKNITELVVERLSREFPTPIRVRRKHLD